MDVTSFALQGVKVDQEYQLSGNGDGIIAWDGKIHAIKGCIVSFKSIPKDKQDEMLSVTYGSDATLTDIQLMHGNKALMFGSGDPDVADKEAKARVDGKWISIRNFGRRGPEVQAGYTAVIRDSTISNWGVKDQFDVRSFAGWAHHGSDLTFINCRFEQTSFLQSGLWNFIKDWFNHIGQAVNYSWWNLLSWKTYLPGVCRGAIATDGGKVKCINCTKNRWWIYLENRSN